MNVLSLFDGMACGMLAMKASGVNVDRYVAYEIDKYAIKVATHNFPDIEEKGDVFAADFTQYEGIDWLIGGSPCTYWSIAQTKNRETTASGLGWDLFSQYVRALHEAKPKFFIYENNKSMSKNIRDMIRKTFGFEEICINSALVSAQNRQRYYWVGVRQDDGTYQRADVYQPDDRGILLKDVLDQSVALRDKANCLAANRGGVSIQHDLTESRTNLTAEPVNVTADGKARTIRATCYKDGIRNLVGNDVDRKTGVAEPVAGRVVGRRIAVPCAVNMRTYEGAGRNPNEYEYKWNVQNSGKKSASLTSSDTRRAIAEPIPQYATAVEWDEAGNPTKAVSGADGKTYTVYKVSNGQITIKGKQYPIKLADGYWIIRKLTVSECKRLQTVPDWYDMSCISDTRCYQCLGNGWTIEIIKHLINCCLK